MLTLTLSFTGSNGGGECARGRCNDQGRALHKRGENPTSQRNRFNVNYIK